MRDFRFFGIRLKPRGFMRIVLGVLLILLGITGIITPIMPGWVFLIPGIIMVAPGSRLGKFLRKVLWRIRGWLKKRKRKLKNFFRKESGQPPEPEKPEDGKGQQSAVKKVLDVKSDDEK